MAKYITLEDLDGYLDGPDESPNVKPASEYLQKVIDRFYNKDQFKGSRLPFDRHEHTIQFRPGELSLWLGINGHGKSLVLGQYITWWMALGDRACIASMEMKPEVTLQRMCRQAAQCEEPAISFLNKFHKWSDDRLWIYDQQGTVKAERILSVVRYFADKLQGNHFVIDSLLKCGIPEDDFNRQKWFVDELTAVCRDKNIHVHLVHHSRKLGDENAPPGKMDAKGSGSITDQVDNCITVWRNKKKESDLRNGKPNDSPDALMLVDKQRHGEWEGCIPLWFDPKSWQFKQSEHAPPVDLVRP